VAVRVDSIAVQAAESAAALTRASGLQAVRVRVEIMAAEAIRILIVSELI
jgi:hypothetical protein